VRTRLIATCVLVSLAFCFVPFPSTLTPSTAIRVIDQSGNPVRDAKAYRSWKHYGLGREGSEEKQTSQRGETIFNNETGWANLCFRAYHFLRTISPHMSFGSHTHVEIYCPLGYELRLSEPDFTPIDRSNDFASCKSKSGESLFIDYRPPDPKATMQYSVRVCLDYHRTSRIEFILPTRKVEPNKQ